jgi:hypothetical protein
VRPGHPALKLLHDLGEEAAGPRGVSRSSFVVSAVRELSVGLCRGSSSALGDSDGPISDFSQSDPIYRNRDSHWNRENAISDIGSNRF